MEINQHHLATHQECPIGLTIHIDRIPLAVGKGVVIPRILGLLLVLVALGVGQED